jgi:hypothetical protein
MLEAEATHESVEDPTRRTETSTTFANPDGTWTTKVSMSPVNFRNADGEWKPIDTSLVDSSRPGYVAANARNSFDLLIPADAGSSPVRLEDQAGGWLSFALHGQQGTPKAAIP